VVTIGFTTGEHTIIAAASNRPRDLDEAKLEYERNKIGIESRTGDVVARSR
jgi:hypothetical protein